MRTAALCLLPAVIAHPGALECGTDSTSRLKVGATIMGAPVVAGAGKVPPGGSGVEIMTTSDKLVEFKASSDVFFAIKAFGPGAQLTCHEGFNNLTATANCTSQIYTASALAKGPQFFICDHTKATGFAIGYGTGGAVSVVTSTVPGTVNVQPAVAK